MKILTSIPTLLQGSIFHDSRGSVSFVNEFTFAQVKRFYIVQNKEVKQVRAWHAHMKEAKNILCISGKARVCAVPVDTIDNPSKDAHVYSFNLDATIPAVLHIPAGYANGFQSLTKNAKLMFFSTSTLEESKADDFRFPADYWDIWGVKDKTLLTT